MTEIFEGSIDFGDAGGRVRVIEDLELRHPARNIGLEEAISTSVAERGYPPTIRFWRNRNSAIIGRSQEAEVELDLKECRNANIPVIRRPTGGGAVLHHPDNLNYSIYLPAPTQANVAREVEEISGAISASLSEFGPRMRVRTNGLFVDDIKVGGIAQSRRKGLLHHGTLLVARNALMEEMGKFLKAVREDYGTSSTGTGVRSRFDPVSDLTSLAGRKTSLPELVEILAIGLANRLDLVPVWGEITKQEWKMGKHLGAIKYSTSSWNFRFYDDVKEKIRPENEMGVLDETG